MFVGRLSPGTRALGRSVLQMRGREMRRSVRKSTSGYGVLVAAEVVSMATETTMIVMLIVHVVLVSMILTLEGFAEAHLRLEGLMRCAAVE